MRGEKNSRRLTKAIDKYAYRIPRQQKLNPWKIWKMMQRVNFLTVHLLELDRASAF
jgi:hypothetical protein